jgi:Fe-S-cluster containining protein
VKKIKFDYPRNIRFKCLKCALCCGDTENRVRSILLFRIEAEWISRKTCKRLDDFAENVEGFEPYVYRMKKTSEGKCLFLRNNMCSIYPERPLICRFYPFQLESVRTDRYAFDYTTECPGIGKGPQLEKRAFEKLFKKLTDLVNKNSRRV